MPKRRRLEANEVSERSMKVLEDLQAMGDRRDQQAKLVARLERLAELAMACAAYNRRYRPLGAKETENEWTATVDWQDYGRRWCREAIAPFADDLRSDDSIDVDHILRVIPRHAKEMLPRQDFMCDLVENLLKASRKTFLEEAADELGNMLASDKDGWPHYHYWFEDIAAACRKAGKDAANRPAVAFGGYDLLECLSELTARLHSAGLSPSVRGAVGELVGALQADPALARGTLKAAHSRSGTAVSRASWQRYVRDGLKAFGLQWGDLKRMR